MTVPRRITQTSADITYDTVPNRFVKYVLTRWRNIAADIDALVSGASASEQRGRREARLVISDLEMALSSPAMAEAGALDAFPHANQVLQGRAGYREILEAFLLAEAAASINWEDRGQLFKAGQRDVASLYEYWVFLELVRVVEKLPGFWVDKRKLIRRSENGLSLELRRTGTAVVTARGARRATPIVVKLWFNKTFSATSEESNASWTVAMRPDCSIQIVPEGRFLSADTWLHFDAKYRIQELTQGLEEPSHEPPVQEGLGNQRPVASDLAKMHAYRDAIRRTAGAYVLYPGGDDAATVRHAEYHEILPGLGAFALRPTEDGEASSKTSSALIGFLDEVVDHVAAQGTDAERARYWSSTTYRESLGRRVDYDTALRKPPADTSVLLGYLRNDEHRSWVVRTGLYNLRADTYRAGAIGVDAPELTPDFVLLYGTNDGALLMKATGIVSVLSASDLESSGYPRPGGSRYFCLHVEPMRALGAPAGELARAMATRDSDSPLLGAPVLVSWLEVTALFSQGASIPSEYR
jgi:hypothetical protein